MVHTCGMMVSLDLRDDGGGTDLWDDGGGTDLRDHGGYRPVG